MKKRILWTFNWNEGGFNSVWAGNRKEAIANIAKEFPGNDVCKLTPNLDTLTPRESKKSQDAYWDSIPLMD